MITAEHIKNLLELQKATNVAYFGEEWKKYWTDVAVANSIYREWAEFLDEVSTSWKIYGNDQQWHQVNAVYELVDVVHFMLCAVIQKEAEPHDMYDMTGYVSDQPIQRKPDFLHVTNLFTHFMSHPERNVLAAFLAYACGYLGLDAETYMLAHKRKNDRNRLRAAGGANYDKSAETPLTLEF
ncbi:putative dUTP diphosphatase [Salmonella phage vB-SalM-PM10]|uniref:dUTP diphosphatase n=1 Tax=Salmonella phage vB-SalM-PM10 TaxID=1868654 RepID=A0A1B0Z106_9CAUD|nr:nucleoside triphosphate pyrophosphohydrolase [Salmonella phage vB-SalM-PM10]ANO57743.1 putative dUTP diphosphatase [Salmonella phage vB-SalM-PM10]QKE54702.1 putative dUTP diphosphatase [Escherichia phage vB_EcoA_4HA11]